MSADGKRGTRIELRGLAVDAPGGRGSGATILGPLDLALEAGSYTCVLGASGSGKTTLLRAVAGLATPSAGRASVMHKASDKNKYLETAPHRRHF